MGEIVNLRRTRKRKAREAQAEQAAENRARYGLTRLERQAAEQTKQHTDRALDGACLTNPAEN